MIKSCLDSLKRQLEKNNSINILQKNEFKKQSPPNKQAYFVYRKDSSAVNKTK